MEEALTRLRELVRTYGNYDEGSESQAIEIVATLNIAVYELEKAIFERYPAVEIAAREGII